MAISANQLLGLGGSVADYFQRRSATGNIQKSLASGTQAASDLYNPYASAGQQGVYNLRAMVGGGAKPAYDYHNPGSLTEAAALSRSPAQALESDPGYQFRLSEGNKAIEREAAAKGTLLSGGTLKRLAEYNQGLASQEYNNAFSRNSQLAGMGMDATGQQAQLRQQLSEAIAGGDFARAQQLSGLLGQGLSALGGMGGAAGGPGGGVAGLGGIPLKAIGAGLGKGLGAIGGAIGSIPVAGQIALGAAGAFLLGKKLFGIGNTHQKADTWVQGNQNQFTDYMKQIGEMEKTGQFTPEQAKAARDNTVQQYLSSAQEFAGQGKDQKKVINQAINDPRVGFRAVYGDPSQYGASFALPGADMNKTLQAMGFNR